MFFDKKYRWVFFIVHYKGLTLSGGNHMRYYLPLHGFIRFLIRRTMYIISGTVFLKTKRLKVQLKHQTYYFGYFN